MQIILTRLRFSRTIPVDLPSVCNAICRLFSIWPHCFIPWHIPFNTPLYFNLPIQMGACNTPKIYVRITSSIRANDLFVCSITEHDVRICRYIYTHYNINCADSEWKLSNWTYGWKRTFVPLHLNDEVMQVTVFVARHNISNYEGKWGIIIIIIIIAKWACLYHVQEVMFIPCPRGKLCIWR